MRWSWRVARRKCEICTQGFGVKNVKEGDHFPSLDVDRWIFMKYEGWAWTRLVQPMARTSECGIGLSVSIKCGEFLD
jgi:hypothetical protein